MKTPIHSILVATIFSSIAISSPIPGANPDGVTDSALSNQHPWTQRKWWTRDEHRPEHHGWESGEFNHHGRWKDDKGGWKDYQPGWKDHHGGWKDSKAGWREHHGPGGDHKPHYPDLLSFWRQNHQETPPPPPTTTGQPIPPPPDSVPYPFYPTDYQEPATSEPAPVAPPAAKQ